METRGLNVRVWHSPQQSAYSVTASSVVTKIVDKINNYIPYSQKYRLELNLAVEPKIAIARILADLNFAVRYGIAIRIYASRKFWWILIWRL